MITVIGDRIDDLYLHYRATRTSHGRPVVERERSETQPGGAAATAAMCRALGVDAVLVATDAVSLKVRHVVDGAVMFREDFDQQASAAKTVEAMRRAVPGDLVVLSDYGKGTVSRMVVELACAWGVPTIVDPYPGVSPGRYRDTSLCCPSWDTYVGLREEWAAVRPLAVKMDCYGALLITRKTARLYPAVPVKEVDSCGAGDQWIAALAVSLHNGSTLDEAVRWANLAAAIKCTRRGTEPVRPGELRWIAEAPEPPHAACQPPDRDDHAHDPGVPPDGSRPPTDIGRAFVEFLQH